MIEDCRFRTVELSDPPHIEGLRLATVKSAALKRRADVSVWVPKLPEGSQEIDTLLILLHGVYGSHWAWSLRGGAHRTAQRMVSAEEIAPIIIAMPSDGLSRDGSGYIADAHGEDAERWIVDEVSAVACLAAPSLRRDAKIAIAGLSMGGYGALRLGAKYADRFSAISAHSAITEIAGMQNFVIEPIEAYLQSCPKEELSPLYWLRRNRNALPRLRFDCGLEDPLLEGNRILHRTLEAENIPHRYDEFPGAHEWSYWQSHVEQTLKFVAGAFQPDQAPSGPLNVGAAANGS